MEGGLCPLWMAAVNAFRKPFWDLAEPAWEHHSQERWYVYLESVLLAFLCWELCFNLCCSLLLSLIQNYSTTLECLPMEKNLPKQQPFLCRPFAVCSRGSSVSFWWWRAEGAPGVRPFPSHQPWPAPGTRLWNSSGDVQSSGHGCSFSSGHAFALLSRW